jgi:hypothetical protein
MIDNQFDLALRNSYQKVFELTLTSINLDSEKLLESKGLFTFNERSLVYNTNHFHVSALLGGLPFSNRLQEYVVDIQRQIDQILQTSHRYWVKPDKLAVEYFVSKWPQDIQLTSKQHSSVKCLIQDLKPSPFNFIINGLQFHRDGCVVLRGFDSNNIRGIRDTALSKLSWLPRHQSAWAHVPIGRILCHITPQKYLDFIDLCKLVTSSPPIAEKINKVTYLDEYRWYMEEYSTIFTKELL